MKQYLWRNIGRVGKLFFGGGAGGGGKLGEYLYPENESCLDVRNVVKMIRMYVSLNASVDIHVFACLSDRFKHCNL